MSKKKKPTPAEDRADSIAKLVKLAKKERTANDKLLRDLRKDPGLAGEVKTLLCADLVRVSEIPREILGPSASRDRYRQFGYYSTSLIDFIYGQWAEFKRKAGLADSLQTGQVKRNIARTSRAQDVAAYADEHISPWNSAYDKLHVGKKPFSILIGSDFHSHFCNPFALRCWNDIIRDESPEAIRINGDLVDFPQLSRHRHFPGHFPMSVQDEIDWAVKKVLEPARKNAPRSDIKFVIGNHDVRLAIALADNGPMFGSLRDMSFASLFNLDELEIGLVCRSNFLNLSSRQRAADIAQNWETICTKDGRMLWTTVHGWLCGKDAPRKHLTRFMTNGTNGHLHDRQIISGGSLATGVLNWYQTPCMAHPEAVAAGYIHGPVEATGWTCGALMVTICPVTGHVSGDFLEVGAERATFRGRSWSIRQSERDQIAQMLQI